MYMPSRERVMELNRGDSFSRPLFINVGTKLKKRRYILSYDDEVYLSICEPKQDFEKGILRKVFTTKDLNKEGDVVVKLSSSDTEDLVPGLYYIEIKIKLTNGNLATILPKRKFYINE